MAHAIENVDGQDRMIYVGETPWHGLGQKFDVPPTIAEAAEITHAGAEVFTTPLQAVLPDGTVLPDLVDRQAIIRREDSKVLATVGNGYVPIQALDVFNQALPAIDAGFLAVETMGVLDEGRRPWMQCKILNTDCDIVANDTIAAYMLFFMSHDGLLAAGCLDTATRVVCQNTLNAALGKAYGKAIKIRHTKNGIGKIGKIGELVEAKRATFQYSVDAFRTLASVQVNSDTFRQYIRDAFSEEIGSRVFRRGMDEDELRDAEAKAETAYANLHEEILPLFEKGRGNDLPGVKGTAWGALNAVSEYLTWQRGRTADKRVNNLFFGQSARTNQNAFTAALKLAA